MTTMRILRVALLGLMFLFSCNPPHSTTEINLDKGNKWKVNEEMKPYILQENKILKDFIASNSKDYKQLANDLQIQNNSFIQSSTMIGFSLEELRKWHNPHKELIENLSMEKDLSNASLIITQLDLSLKNFHTYFE